MEMQFGTILKNLREEKSLAQKTVAEKAGVSEASISFWENGKREPKLSNLIALSKFFGVSIDYLAGLKDY